ncbi:hypothetical protein HDE_08895 [Halotydeus destructor]|nr:hypothetical protein HDE_08895 [Halotydeus destructor]
MKLNPVLWKHCKCLLKNIRGLSTAAEPSPESVYQHPMFEKILIGSTSQFPVTLANVSSSCDRKVLHRYWPEEYRCDVTTDSGCMVQVEEWSRQVISNWTEKDKLRHLELAPIDTLMPRWQPDFNRRVLALKLVYLQISHDEALNSLVESGDEGKQSLAFNSIMNVRHILSNLPWRPLDVSTYEAKCFKEAQCLKEHEDAFASLCSEMPKLISSKYLQQFRKSMYQVMDGIGVQFLLKANMATGQFVTQEHFKKIVPLSSCFPFYLWASFDEEDIDNIETTNPVMRMISMMYSVDKDIWSYPSTKHTHDPWSVLRTLVHHGYSVEDAMMNMLKLRNDWMRSILIMSDVVSDSTKTSVRKCLYTLAALELFNSHRAQYGYEKVPLTPDPVHVEHAK